MKTTIIYNPDGNKVIDWENVQVLKYKKAGLFVLTTGRHDIESDTFEAIVLYSNTDILVISKDWPKNDYETIESVLTINFIP